MRKFIIVVVVIASLGLGGIGGYFYRDAQTDPKVKALGIAMDFLERSEAKAQVAYEATQAQLATKQQELDTTIVGHELQLTKIHVRWAASESSLKLTLADSQRKIAIAEVAVEPPTVPNLTTLSAAPCLQEFQLAAQWEGLAIKRKNALESLKAVSAKYESVNEILLLEIDKEKAYRASVEQQSYLWKKRYKEADKHVNKLRGSRLKWTAGVIAGVALGFYAAR